jgi:hypothetical protein
MAIFDASCSEIRADQPFVAICNHIRKCAALVQANATPHSLIWFN